MKRESNDFIKVAVMGLVLPVLLLSLVIELPEGVSAKPPETQATQPTVTVPSEPTYTPALPGTVPAPTEPEPTQPEPTEPIGTEPVVTPQIPVMFDGELRQMDMEEYLLGVVLAEMPASFHEEALKAQAVASRSYTLRCCYGAGNHKEGYICTSSGCCQAYISPESYISRGGKWANVQKVWTALQDTRGQILMYGGNVVLATYFSCSGGSTESALTVFGVDYPYLQPVESPGEEGFGSYHHTVSFTQDEFMEALGLKLTGEPQTWFGEVTHTSGGGVDTIYIGGAVFDGGRLKGLLGLRSSNFTVSVSEGNIVIETFGFGHRVGMSQYGALAMAQAGKTYVEILQHYYIGAELAHYAG